MHHSDNRQILRSVFKFAGGLVLVATLSACNEDKSNFSTSSAGADIATDSSTALDARTDISPITASEDDSLVASPSRVGRENALVLHLEADAGVSSSSNIVTDWADQSGGNNSLSSVGAPELVESALNNLPVIRFDGFESRLERTSDLSLPEGNRDRTIMVLADYDGVGAGGVGYGHAECNRAFQAIVDNQGNSSVQAWCSAHDANSGVDVASTGWVIHTVILQSSEIHQYRNDELIDARQHTFDTIARQLVVGGKIGNTSFAKMSVAAVFIWEEALSPEDFATALDYLRAKYLQPLGSTSPGSEPTPSEANTPVAGEDTPVLPLPGRQGEEITPISPPELPNQPGGPDVPQAPAEPSVPELPEPAPLPQPEPAPTPAPEPAPTPEPPQPPVEPTPPPAEAASVRMWTSNPFENLVQLNWEASGADICEASGAWRGTKATSGIQRFTGRDIGDTFQLNCQGAGGSALGMVTVVDKGIRMTWQPPANTPEGEVTYGIHWGEQSGIYTNSVNVDSQRAWQMIDVVKGPLHLTMTTTNANGETSEYSNELMVTIE